MGMQLLHKCTGRTKNHSVVLGRIAKHLNAVSLLAVEDDAGRIQLSITPVPYTNFDYQIPIDPMNRYRAVKWIDFNFNLWQRMKPNGNG